MRMARALRPIDITDIPELIRIAEEVRVTKEPRLLRRDGEDLAVITPVRPMARKTPRGRPTSADDPIWNIVGMARSKGPGDVSENVDKYLAEAYLGHHFKTHTKRRVKGRPTSADDPLWNIVGMASSAEPTDASKKHEYLADVYTSQKP